MMSLECFRKTATTTLTFCDSAENHKGMQQIGDLFKSGFTREQIEECKTNFEELGCTCEIHDFTIEGKTEDACILVIRDGVSKLVDKDKLTEEQMALKKDTKAFMYGRVVNKHARYNLCFSNFSQEANFEEKKGTVYDFKDVPHLRMLKKKLYEMISLEGNIQCEGNYYYDISKCYIGWHGDTERKIVIAARLGATMPIHYQWYHNNKAVEDKYWKIDLHDGDMYVMSSKAVGYDWKKKSIYTLRHAAGHNV